MGRKLLIISALILVMAVGWLWLKREPTLPAYQNISVAEFDAILASRDPFVVDVHTPEQKHLEGTDAFIDFTKVGERLNEFPQDKNAEILVYCRSGSMSKIAAETLLKAGYTNIKNLAGGLQAWQAAH